eukprot:TRINITY_DN630_c0_g1_i21.p1 TRINITY_DN630_c0_g1~~TRINITY_DN630_c0_g1_i21.p1  ORF type:complete len:783 (-),score=189.58 TRINITY_DN630_c0_g1_i21:61-2322(-)
MDSGNDCSRIFTDHLSKYCYPVTASTTQRCFSSGQSCSNHAIIPTFSLSTRPQCTACGDGCTDPVDGFEECDDGNTAGGDGCSATCHVEPGWTCPHSTDFKSICTRVDQALESCLDHRRRGSTISGVYAVTPPGVVTAAAFAGSTSSSSNLPPPRPIRWVYCDMATDPDPSGTAGAEAGGWAIMASFAATDSTSFLEQWRYDKHYRLALWIEGAGEGAPLRLDAEQLVDGQGLRVWSHDWREHLVPGRMYELRQRCEQRGGTNIVDLAFDTVYPGHVKQTGGDLGQSWRLWNRRVLTDQSDSVWGTGDLRKWYFRTPFKETDAPFTGGVVLTACSSYGFDSDHEGCCDCSVADNRRYGEAGIVYDLPDSRDLAFSQLPSLTQDGSVRSIAVQQGLGSDYSDIAPSTAVFSTTCQYWMRPKPSPKTYPDPKPSLDPLVRIQFEPGQMSKTIAGRMRNLGTLGTASDAQIVGCGADPLGATHGPRGHAISFTGNPSTCRVEIPVPDTLRFLGDPWTLAFWFKFRVKPSTLTGGQILLIRGNGDGTWQVGESIVYLTSEAPTVPISMAPTTVSFTMGWTKQIGPSTATTPDDTDWHHYAFTSNVTSGTGVAYVDGLPAASYASNEFPLFQQPRDPSMSPDKITLGGRVAFDGNHASGDADGEMDDFAWFRRALDATEITALMAEHDFRDRDDSLCGNRQLDTRGHTCDDGNSVSGDGCDRHCMLELDVDCGKARFPCIEKAKPKRKSWKEKRKGGG